MANRKGIQDLSNELLDKILEFVDPFPPRSVSIEARAFLSKESLKAPHPSPRFQAQDVARFREVCKRFAEIGIPHQFARITIRFSKAGFERLDWLSKRPELARHTKKFSYMVPYFYEEGRDRVEDLPRDQRTSSLDIPHLSQKAKEHKELRRSRRDLASLGQAMTAFTDLQHVQILRLVDPQSGQLLRYINDTGTRVQHIVDLRWTPAYIHSVRTMGEALLSSNSHFTKFSGPMTNPESALRLQDSPSPIIAHLAKRLTCLELQFVEAFDLNSQMQELSSLLRTVFLALENIRAINILFPPSSPLDLRLEKIFHNVMWRDLRVFGIQSWRLNAGEIIDMARRHRSTLKGIRLRDVLLLDGSRWKDVIEMFHGEMDHLNWVSLRGIDYAKSWDAQRPRGREITGYEQALYSDSEDEDNEEDDFAYTNGSENGVGGDEEEQDLQHEGLHEEDNDISSLYASSPEHHNDDHGPNPAPWSLPSEATPSALWPASSQPSIDEDLGDNRETVPRELAKLWERYAVSGIRRR